MAAERLTFLFWNVQGKPLEQTLRRLIALHDVDFLLVGESAIVPDALEPLIRCLPRVEGAKEPRVKLFARGDGAAITPQNDDTYFTLWRLSPPNWDELLLIGAHLPSKLRAQGADQEFSAGKLSMAIRQQERERGHQRSLLLGDLNMNPFEPGVVAFDRLHAIGDRSAADTGTRRIQGEERPFFYNPMWSLLGDRSEGPPGTYFYDRSGVLCYFWNTFDQALLRPALLRACTLELCRVLTEDGSESFLDARGRPNATRFSDHLPILIRLTKEL